MINLSIWSSSYVFIFFIFITIISYSPSSLPSPLFSFNIWDWICWWFPTSNDKFSPTYSFKTVFHDIFDKMIGSDIQRLNNILGKFCMHIWIEIYLVRVAADEGPFRMEVTMAPVGRFDQWARGRHGWEGPSWQCHRGRPSWSGALLTRILFYRHNR